MPTEAEIDFILDAARHRGRDGWGVWANGTELRGRGEIPQWAREFLKRTSMVVGNFRAAPTTEAESREDILQPYSGWVHNGVIANDREFGQFEIDSQCLPVALGTKEEPAERFLERIMGLHGSFSLMRVFGPSIRYAANYKPLYWGFGETGAVLLASLSSGLPCRSWSVPPYSVGELTRGGLSWTSPIPRRQSDSALVACSGGLDSVTAAYLLRETGKEVTLVHFSYGCLAEKKERERIEKIAAAGKFPLIFLTIPFSALGGSLIEGRYEADGIKGAEYAHDWISARNLVMLSLLTALAETRGHGYIAFGGNLEEAGAYPDNEEEFAERFAAVLPFAVQNGVKIDLLHPVSHLMKHEIVKEGLRLGVPFELTWSCYGDGERHCGTCGPCFMRKTAFDRNGRRDPVFEEEAGA